MYRFWNQNGPFATNLIFHFILLIECLFYFFFFFFLKMTFFQVRKRSIECFLEALPAHKSLQSFISKVWNTKASCKNCFAMCAQMLKRTLCVWKIPEVAFVHYCALGMKERLQALWINYLNVHQVYNILVVIIMKNKNPVFKLNPCVHFQFSIKSYSTACNSF